MSAKPRQRDKVAGMGQVPQHGAPFAATKRRKPSERVHGYAQVQLAESSVVDGFKGNLEESVKAGHGTVSVLFFVPRSGQVLLFHRAMTAQMLLIVLRIRR